MKISINSLHLFMIPVVIWLFSACNVAKIDQKPALSLPQQYLNASADSSNIADIKWQELFTEPSLQALIQKGIDYNFDLQEAINRIDIAQQQLNQAKLLNLPGVDLGVGGQYNRPSENSLNGLSIEGVSGSKHYEDYSVGVNASWEADIWGKIKRQKKVALLQYLQTKEAKKAIQTKLVSDIATGFYNLLMLEQQEQIAASSLQLADSTLRLTNFLKTAGQVTELSVQQTFAQRQTVALLIPQLQEEISRQQNAIQVLTGQFPATILTTVKLSDFNPPATILTGLPAAIVGHRPDVRSAELDLLIAGEKIGIANANMYPSLTISASGGVEALKASNWFNIPGSLFGLVAGSIAQPLFEKRALKTNYEIAKTERSTYVLKFRQSVLNAVTEVSNSLMQFKKLQESELISSKQVEILQHAISNATLLYKSGIANYLEIITAQNNALQAKLNLSYIHCQELTAVVDVYRSLGGGWN